MKPLVALAVGTRQSAKVLGQLLRSAMCDIVVLNPNETVDEGFKCELLVVDAAYLAAAGAERANHLLTVMRKSLTKVLVMNEGSLDRQIPGLFRDQGVTNLLAQNETFDTVDAVITVNKLLSRDIFGLKKYLPWGMRVVERTIYTSARVPQVLSELEEFAEHTGCDRRLANAFVCVADEFITNALYNAPVGPDGAHLFRHLKRTESVELPVGREVSLKYGCDGAKLVMSICDRFGSLSVDMLTHYLERWFEHEEHAVRESSGGAGLGLLYIFKYLSAIIVNIAPGSCTEFIGFIDISGTYKDFIQKHKSFHIFTGAPQASW